MQPDFSKAQQQICSWAMDELRVATFNCEWRRTPSRDAELIRERVLAGDVEVACLTETHVDFFGDHGFSVSSAPFDTGVHSPSRRKVLLWSQRPWRNVQLSGPDSSPPGPHLTATTDTSMGELTFIGIIIPYRWAGMNREPRSVQVWQRHMEFLTSLDDCLSETPERTVILGDFNQRVPRKYQPARVFAELERVLLRRFNLATSGELEPVQRLAIDHICHSRDLACGRVCSLSNVRPDGRLISDHFGVRVELARAEE